MAGQHHLGLAYWLSSGQRLRTIVPRSLHLPVAVTEGSPIENLNEIGVRFWTDCSPPKAWSSWAQEMSRG